MDEHRVRIVAVTTEGGASVDERCFRIHFRMVQDKFGRLEKVIAQSKFSIDQKELAAVREAVRVISRHNIREVEKRIDALSASLIRKR